jgi:sugar phosphate isomerase/epimerase
MKVTIGTYSFGGIESYLGLGPTLNAKFQLIKSLGFDGVELLPVDLDNPVEDIKAWADEAGLEIVSVHAKPSEEIVKKMAALGGTGHLGQHAFQQHRGSHRSGPRAG